MKSQYIELDKNELNIILGWADSYSVKCLLRDPAVAVVEKLRKHRRCPLHPSAENNLILESQEAWTVWINTSPDKEKGFQHPLTVCELASTAERLAKEERAQGFDAIVSKSTIVKRNHQWLGPTRLQIPTAADIDANTKTLRKKALMLKALDKGMTAEELQELGVMS